MKKIILSMSALIAISQMSFAQNTYPYPSTGNVGIGIASPAGKFQVYGGNAVLWGITLGYGVSSSIITTDSPKPISFQITGVEKMRIDATGNVGIGTTSPTQMLDVAGNIVANGISLSRDGTTRNSIWFATAGDVNHRLYNNYSNTDGEGGFDGIKWNVYAGLNIRVGAAKTTALFVNSGGNVGIGTTSPNATLHIIGAYSGGTGDMTNITNAQLRLESSAGFIRIPHISADFSVSTVYNYQTNKSVFWGESSDVGHYYFRGRNILVTEGKVGIGTGNNTPLAQLQIADIYSPGGKNLLIGDDAYLTDIDQTNILGIYGNANSDRSGIQLGSNGPTLFGLNGNVGIGTTTPSDKLQINPNGAGGIVIGTNPGSGGYTNLNMGVSAQSGGYSYIQSIKSSGSALGDIVLNKDGGNVGIGTITPTQKLEVAGGAMKVSYNSGQVTAASLDNISGPLGNNGIVENNAGDVHIRGFWGVVIDKNGGNYGESASYSNGVNPAGGSFAVRTRTSTTAFRTDFIVRNSGNIGIGTTAPVTNLHISTSALSSSPLKLQSTAGSATVGIDFLTYAGDNTGIVSRISAIESPGNRGILTFYTNGTGGTNSSAVTERMRIDQNGYVGINITSPTEQLHVAGNIKVTGLVKTNDICVSPGGSCDFVFNEDYKLNTIAELKAFIQKNKHLPHIQSEKDIVSNGTTFNNMVFAQLRTVEELVLYTIQQQEALDKQGEKIKEMEKALAKLLEAQK